MLMYSTAKPVRLGYLSGPVDALELYERYCAGREPRYFGTSYLSQLFAEVERTGGAAVVISTLSGGFSDVRRGAHRFVNLPSPDGATGWRYHWGMVRWAAAARRIFARERLDAVVLTAGQNYFFMHWPLLRQGVRMIVSLHCLLQPKAARPRATWRILQQLNARTVLKRASAILCVSHDIAEQVRFVVSGSRPKVFVPTYDEGQFADAALPVRADGEPFRLLYVGRVEANKGPFDLLAAAERLATRPDMPRFTLAFCGDGSALPALREAVARSPIAASCTVEGGCPADAVRRRYRDCHVVVVPTRSAFEEGYNKVCAEAVLARRPVVTSVICPALADIRAAAIEVEPDSVEGYADAIHALATDAALYARKVAATGVLRQSYFEVERSYGVTLRRALQRLGERAEPVGAAG